MRRRNLYTIRVVLFILIIGIITSSCGLREDAVEENRSEEDMIQEDYENEIGLDVGGKDHDLLLRSEGISDVVVNLYGIENATSIIFNDIVAISVKLADGYTLTDGIKEMIMNTALKKDTMIRQVLITDDKEIFNEIEVVLEALLNGRSYDDQVKKINRIIEKIKNE
ncbi:YhcN/YlaJ family sporulation lipoprotein [Schnuerera sp. xch1]|uniref:YhcN/YlaJ family sporulation lipoprotein n=1 Tax=Schnuerera sp. xch1 TaxID=2874283 RepID=UPI001CBD4A7E|nr:YhcN/YlaJ family sporulation lipoprotein [Schnuerera sp. xch1]MBZ2173665.1 YhcN/YlaJ family sporulation lipoprotein [Schnuerera sp. xch1]